MFTFLAPVEERKNMLQRLVVVLLIALTFTIVIIIERQTYQLWQLIAGIVNGALLWLFIDVGDYLLFQTGTKRFPVSWKRLLFAVAGCISASFCSYLISDQLTGLSLFSSKSVQVLSWAVLNTMLTFVFIWIVSQRQLHKENQISTNEARLKLLESQLEPHMLFNTLANLRALIQTDTVLATKMLDRIVDYMRATLGGSRTTMHSLREEFERLDDYLDLMKLRMGDRLNYSLYLCPELDNHLVPPFILQPLLENAIKHGLEPKVEGGSIFIVAAIEGMMVSLEVSDTGVGANKDDLENTKGFGWAQVSERLIATYGDKATINLVALEGYTTSAKITFPYIEAESPFE